MSGTVKQLADMVRTPVDRLLEQFRDAGVSKHGPDDPVSDEEKMVLLESLRRSHGRNEGAPKITLRRKQNTEIKVPGGPQTRKTINVETRLRATRNARAADGFRR